MWRRNDDGLLGGSLGIKVCKVFVVPQQKSALPGQWQNEDSPGVCPRVSQLPLSWTVFRMGEGKLHFVSFLLSFQCSSSFSWASPVPTSPAPLPKDQRHLLLPQPPLDLFLFIGIYFIDLLLVPEVPILHCLPEQKDPSHSFIHSSNTPSLSFHCAADTIVGTWGYSSEQGRRALSQQSL